MPPEAPPRCAKAQRQQGQDIAPLSPHVPPYDAFDLVRKAAQNRGPRIVEAVKPGGRFGLGRIEAVDRTFLLRLPDDITVRNRPRADGTRVDIRSASRIGTHDFGANAARIRAFLKELSEPRPSTRRKGLFALPLRLAEGLMHCLSPLAGRGPPQAASLRSRRW